ncbi:hypothetical protein Asppvi_010738 [Aspergillus pseudoviridinutans]|uniref:Uncharacterized protein n=1 Tax=Aspergillus pseudoviridinutans TaxID=1517512 RepID=A0A9P3F0D1_9EURO|nr:uncharacterized protein Asppvi_010738 [Aspergillus pseudoviridinutans]GIJ91765.1 hypothetical protein Asppvi_010738 [Aspergillus pseudoviridinutans]
MLTKLLRHAHPHLQARSSYQWSLSDGSQRYWNMEHVSKNADTGKSYRNAGVRWLKERDILEVIQAVVTVTPPTRIPDVGITDRNHFAIGLEYTEQSVVAANDHFLSRDIPLSRHSNLPAANTDQDARGTKSSL